MAGQNQVGLDAGADDGVTEGVGDLGPVAPIQKLTGRHGQIVLVERGADMGEEFAALAHEEETTAEQIETAAPKQVAAGPR